jgi:hypothetical protein
MKKVGILVLAMASLCSSTAFAKGSPRETVSVVAHESSTTPYDWEMNGRVSVSCYGNSCSGYYTAPTSGTQQIQGAILRLKRSDSSIVIAQCVAKVNIFASTMMVVDALNANDPNAPTVYRNCRVPDANSIVEAEFHGNSVKLFWHFADSRRASSETYSLVGVLQPEGHAQDQGPAQSKYLPDR